MPDDHGLDAAITDRTVLAGDAYATGDQLGARQRLYDFQHPRYDLPAIVAEHVADRGLVIDIGCGNGRFTTHLRAVRPEATVIGLDISAGILAAIPAPVAVADAMHLPFPDGSVDALLAMHMIYHLPDITAGLREMARVLRPGGILIASTNSRTDKVELGELWSWAAGEVLGTAEGPSRVSLSDRFCLEDATGHLERYFADVTVVELPGTITVTSHDPVIAHLGSYRAWADQVGVPFQDTVDKARSLLERHLRDHGAFHIQCLGGILIGRSPQRTSGRCA